jgi:hypothetical protein
MRSVILLFLATTAKVAYSRWPGESAWMTDNLLTKISSADMDLWSELDDIASGDLTGGEGRSRKGLRDTGRAGGSSKGDAGDAARLRKGLLEERLMLRPADDCWESKI